MPSVFGIDENQRRIAAKIVVLSPQTLVFLLQRIGCGLRNLLRKFAEQVFFRLCHVFPPR